MSAAKAYLPETRWNRGLDRPSSYAKFRVSTRAIFVYQLIT
jgi:hypothetical protein